MEEFQENASGQPYDYVETGEQVDDAGQLCNTVEAGTAAQPDPSSKLNELEAFLRQPDAVMEPNIMEHLREYVMANGHPQQAVEYLTDSYVGESTQRSQTSAQRNRGHSSVHSPVLAPQSWHHAQASSTSALCTQLMHVFIHSILHSFHPAISGSFSASHPASWV